MKKLSKISTIAGASIVAALALPAAVYADANPFQSTDIAGYQLADAGKVEGKCGAGKPAEGSCGGAADSKKKEGKCGEGKCGGKPEAGAASDKKAEGTCGAGKSAEGSCGGAPASKKAEGKCGEGKCGGNKK